MESCKERAWPSEHVCGPCKVHVRSTSCAAYCTELGLTVKGVRHDTETPVSYTHLTLPTT